MCESCAVGPYQAYGHGNIHNKSSAPVTTSASQIANKVLTQEMQSVQGVQMPSKFISDKSAELLAVTDRYFELITLISTTGNTRQDLIESSMTKDCARYFNGPKADDNRADFMNGLTEVYKIVGPWKSTVMNKIPSSDTNSVTVFLNVELGGKQYTEILFLQMVQVKDQFRISEIRANLTPYGAAL